MRVVINIPMSPTMVKIIKKEVKQGCFAFTSEFFRHFIRLQLANEFKKYTKEFKAGKGKVLNSLKDLR